MQTALFGLTFRTGTTVSHFACAALATLQLQHRPALAQQVGKAKIIGGGGSIGIIRSIRGILYYGEEKHGPSQIN